MIKRSSFTLLLLVCILPHLKLNAQQLNGNYGLKTVSFAEYTELIKADSTKKLVELKQLIPSVSLDIRYATSNNFMGERMYQTPAAYLSLPAAKALRDVQKKLNGMGLGLKIYDAYRPYRVTVAFYEKVKDTVFVASPRRGSRHNRGCAVDLTLIDLKTGKELVMPTPFDDFTRKAHTNYSYLPKDVIENRELLKKVMTSYGFQIYPDEWWHYDFKDWKEHPILDISFEELKEIN